MYHLLQRMSEVLFVFQHFQPHWAAAIHVRTVFLLLDELHSLLQVVSSSARRFDGGWEEVDWHS
jgi:hypothetical protein